MVTLTLIKFERCTVFECKLKTGIRRSGPLKSNFLFYENLDAAATDYMKVVVKSYASLLFAVSLV